MAFTSGTATDYLDLLDELQTFLAAEGWTVHDYVSGSAGKLRVEGPGTGSGRRVFVNIYPNVDAPASIYSWRVRGAINYSSGALEGMNLGEMDRPVYFNLWNAALNYWFYVTDRRFVVVVQCGTVFMSLHAGFFLPWASPAQYPFPLLIAADNSDPVVYNLENARRRMFCDPGGTATEPSAWLRHPSGAWIAVRNQGPSNAANQGIQQNENTPQMTAMVWPWNVGGGNNSYISTQNYKSFSPPNSATNDGGALAAARQTRQNEYGAMIAQIYQRRGPMLGAIEGVFCPFGTQLTSGQTLTQGGRTLRAFQSIHRVTGNNFFAIEEI